MSKCVGGGAGGVELHLLTEDLRCSLGVRPTSGPEAEGPVAGRT